MYTIDINYNLVNFMEPSGIFAFDVWQSGIMVFDHYFTHVDIAEKTSASPFSPTHSINKALASLSLEPVNEPSRLHDKSVKVIYPETFDSQKHRLILPKGNRSRAQAACAKAKEKLLAQGEDLNLEYDDKRGFVPSTSETRNVFQIIETGLVALASVHLCDLLYDLWQDRYIGERNFFKNLEIHVRDAWELREENDCYEKFKRLIYACLEAMDDKLSANIADNICSYYLESPSAALSMFALSHKGLCLARLICEKTKNTSLQQLFFAAFVGNTETLIKCLDAPSINPLTTSYRGEYFIHLAIIQNHVDCVKIALERAIFPQSILLSFWPRLVSYVAGSPEMALLFLQHNILPPPETILGVFKNRHNTLWHPVIREMLIKFPSLQSKIEGSNKTFVEELYFEAVHNTTSEELFCQIVPILKDSLSERIVQHMQERILLNCEKKWLRFLPHEVKIDCAMKLIERFLSPISNYLIELKRITSLLVKELQLHNLDPEGMDAEVIVTAYALKKEVKKVLKKPPTNVAAADLENLQKAYRELENVYDTAVNKHPTFLIVRHLSRIIRKRSERDAIFSLRVKKFLHLWVDVRGQDLNLREVWKKESLSIRRKIAIGCNAAHQLPFMMRRLKILHGTPSVSLPLIVRSGKKLQAAGKLLSQGIAPLTGELATAFNNQVNAKKISAMLADTSWLQKPTILSEHLPGVNGTTRFNIALSYADRAYQETELWGDRHLFFDRQKAYAVFENTHSLIVTGKLEEHLNNMEDPEDRDQFWFDFQIAIMRLKMTGNKEFMEKTEGALKKLSEFEIPELQKCLEIWKAPPKIEIDLLDPLIVDKEPILFASSHFPSDDSLKKSGVVEDFAHTGETVVNCDLSLGDDLDLVFTRKEAVLRIQVFFNREDVRIRVLSLEAGRLLQMRQMTIGSNKLHRFPFKNLNLLQVSRLLHRGVLPHYATPFPKVPSYMQGKDRVLVQWPFFSEKHESDHEAYLKAVKAGEILARSTHGSMHAMRVCLFALMCNFMCLHRGLKLEVRVQFLLLAAGMHDAMRQDEGEDHWDEASAEALRISARDHLGITDESVIHLLYHALKHKDPANHPQGYESLFQRIVHEADFWDYIRTLDDPKNEFDFKYSALMGLPEFKDFPFVQLRDEIIEFIKCTENDALKAYLEMHSQSYLQDLCVIFQMLHEKRGFPLMMQFLKHVCLILAKTATVNKEILAKLLDL